MMGCGYTIKYSELIGFFDLGKICGIDEKFHNPKNSLKRIYFN